MKTSKEIKIILGIIIGVVILYCAIVFTDINRVKSLKKPIFAIQNGYVGSMTRFDGLGYKIGLDINAQTGEITYGQFTTINKVIVKVYAN